MNPFPTYHDYPTNIAETPMVNTELKSLHRSKGTNISIPMDILQHVIKAVMGIMHDELIESFSHWMSYRGFYSFTDICDQLYHISEEIKCYVEYRVNGLNYQLEFSAMHKIKMFIKWMSERMINGSFRLHDEFLPS